MVLNADTCMVSTRVPMALRLLRHSPAQTVCQMCAATFSSALVQSCVLFCFVFFTKNVHFCVHICFPLRILVFTYHTMDGQAVLDGTHGTQSTLKQNGASTSHWSGGPQCLLLPFSFLGWVWLQAVAPRMCMDKEAVC